MPLIIAEAGVNHNGKEDLAFALIDAAHAVGADAVKFQTFNAKNVATKSAEQAPYQAANTKKKETQLEMLSKLELSHETHHKMIKHCQDLGIEFMSTAFDSESLDFLVNEIGLKRLKIASGELTNAPFVLEHARTGHNLIVSTGMASLQEIQSALGVIAFGYTRPQTEPPSEQSFQRAFASPKGKAALREKVTLLHCTSEYPAPFDEINLKAMQTLFTKFSVPCGYSDHSTGVVVPIAAAARGAVIIEKHFTLDKDLEGPDHKASLNPTEFSILVQSVRQVKIALGSSKKALSACEAGNIIQARKSLVAAETIKIGDPFTKENLVVKRPGAGISPYEYWSFLHKTAKQNYSAGDLICE